MKRMQLHPVAQTACAGVILIMVLLGLIPTAAAQNLLPDPSFEVTQAADPQGHVFSKWVGYIYEPPARFIASPIAHTGEYSCEMQSDPRAKIRIFSSPINADAGRYQARAFIRGLDVGPGEYNRPIDFSCGFDGQFFPVHKTGMFGWTAITYTFDYKPAAGANLQLFVGLLGGGRLWVDDASLEKVDASTPLTAEPVIGQEESSIAPPQPVGDPAVRCPQCQYLNNAAADRCYACGAELLHDIADSATPLVQSIADFSDGKTAPFTNGRYSADHLPAGTGGIVIDSNIQINQHQDWSKHDYFRFDTFNPADVPVKLTLEIHDEQTHDYWTRVNLTSVIPPGHSTMSFPTHLYVGEKSRPGRMLLRDQINRVVISVDGGTPVIASRFRLERLDTTAMRFDGLTALSFGPYDAPLMQGFSRATMAMDYSPARGYGWDHAQFWRAMNVLQPDPLTQSFIVPTAGSFRVDLPNGKYHVEMNLDMPGGYWGESQNFQSRQVTANGAVVVNDTMTLDSYIARHFRNAHREDLPGVDTFDDYVQKLFQVKSFDVDVNDGKLLLGFQGEAWANCLSYLIVYPASKATQGKAFLNWVTERRRAEFNDYFKQIEPKHSPAPAKDYAVFTRPDGVAVNAYDGQGDHEGIPDAGLALSIAKDEPADFNFAVQPASDDLGAIDLKLSPFVNEQGARLDPGDFQPGWLDYRITRVEADGSVYTVAPRYWHPVPAPASPKVTRRFWINLRVPAQTPGGVYRGSVTIQPEHGGARAIPVAITVLPFALDPITDVAVGPFGCNIALDWPFPDQQLDRWNGQMFSQCLDVLKQGGCTTFTGVPALKASAANRTVSLDTTLADRQMALIRSKGFQMLIGSYGSGADLGYQMYGNAAGPDDAAATRAGFANVHDFLLALYTAIDQHAQANNWLPIAWNLADEPLGDAVAPSAANALAHRQIVPGLKLTTFTGATSMEGNAPADPHVQLIQALPMPSLNNHDDASLKLLEDAGNAFAFYNSGSRWTYGRYMKMLVLKHKLAFRVSWHFNAVAGDPYYALDCREDDYCWFNTDEHQAMVPSVMYLSQIVPGLNDYRYLSTLQRLLKELPNHPAAAAGRTVFDRLMNLQAGADRSPADQSDPAKAAAIFEHDRAAMANAISELLR